MKTLELDKKIVCECGRSLKVMAANETCILITLNALGWSSLDGKILCPTCKKRKSND